MPTNDLVKGWLESQSAFEARKLAVEKIEADKAAAFDASVKNGTIGRIIRDPEEQKRAAQYRAKMHAELLKNTAGERKVLDAAAAKKAEAEKRYLVTLAAAHKERAVVKAGSAAVLFSGDQDSTQTWTITKGSSVKNRVAESKRKEQETDLRQQTLQDYAKVEAERVVGKAAPARVSMWQPKRLHPVDAETQTLEDIRSLFRK